MVMLPFLMLLLFWCLYHSSDQEKRARKQKRQKRQKRQREQEEQEDQEYNNETWPFG